MWIFRTPGHNCTSFFKVDSAPWLTHQSDTWAKRDVINKDIKIISLCKHIYIKCQSRTRTILVPIIIESRRSFIFSVLIFAWSQGAERLALPAVGQVPDWSRSPQLVTRRQRPQVASPLTVGERLGHLIDSKLTTAPQQHIGIMNSAMPKKLNFIGSFVQSFMFFKSLFLKNKIKSSRKLIQICCSEKISNSLCTWR